MSLSQSQIHPLIIVTHMYPSLYIYSNPSTGLSTKVSIYLAKTEKTKEKKVFHILPQRASFPKPHFTMFFKPRQKIKTNSKNTSLHGSKTRIKPESTAKKEPHDSHASGMPKVPREHTQTRPKNVENADLTHATQPPGPRGKD